MRRRAGFLALGSTTCCQPAAGGNAGQALPRPPTRPRRVAPTSPTQAVSSSGLRLGRILGLVLLCLELLDQVVQRFGAAADRSPVTRISSQTGAEATPTDLSSSNPSSPANTAPSAVAIAQNSNARSVSRRSSLALALAASLSASSRARSPAAGHWPSSWLLPPFHWGAALPRVTERAG